MEGSVENFDIVDEEPPMDQSADAIIEKEEEPRKEGGGLKGAASFSRKNW